MFCLSACVCFLIYLCFNQIIFWFELRWKKRDGKPIDDPILILTDNFRARIIFRELKKTSFIHYSYWTLWTLRRILHCTIFTFWYEDGYSQILYGGLLHLVFLAWFAAFKPFKDSWRNHMEVINIMTVLACFMCVFPYVSYELTDD